MYVNKLKEQAAGPHGHTADSYLFMMSAVTGDADRAFDWVVNAIDNSFSLLLLRYTDPLVAPITRDPRYKAFLADHI